MARDVGTASCVVPVSADNKVLLTQRCNTLRSYPNKWVVPGGKIDAGEDLHSAGLRELSEETGIDTEITEQGIKYQNQDASLTPHMLYETLYPKYGKGNPTSQHVVIFYLLRLPVIAMQINLTLSPDEVSKATWIDSHTMQTINDKSSDFEVTGVASDGSVINIPGG